MKTLHNVAARFINTPVAIAPHKMDVLVAVFGERAGYSADEINAMVEAIESATPEARILAKDWSEPADRKSYQVSSEGIAIIPVQGTLMKKAGGLMALSGCASYEKITSQLHDAVNDSGIKAIMLDVDSPGGETHGLFELSDLIYSMRGTKPIYASADDSAYSAAYTIASAADKVFVTRTGGVGSIGVFALHQETAELDKKLGVKFTYIKAGKKKTAGNPHEPLAKSAESDIQNEVDRQAEMFIATVARNRGVSAEKVEATEAGCLYAEAAVPLLADKVGTFDDAMEELLAKIDGTPSNAKKSGRSATKPEQPSETTEQPVPEAITPNPDIDATTENNMPVIAYHKTATAKATWDGPANKKRLREGESQGYYESAHAFRLDDGNPKSKSDYRFGHHMVSESGDVGAANLKACSSGIAVLNGGRVANIRRKYTQAEREGIHRHLAKHIEDAGETAPALSSQTEYERSIAALAAQSTQPKERADMKRPSALLAIAARKAEEAEDLKTEAVKARKKATAADSNAQALRAEAKKAEDEEADDMEEKCKKADDAEADAEAKKKEADDAEDKADDAKKSSKKATGSATKAKDEQDDDEDDDEDDDTEEDRKKEEARKKAMQEALNPKAIAELCTLAGCPEATAGYLIAGKTVKEVQVDILQKRAAASNKNKLDPNFGTALNTQNGLDAITKRVDGMMAQTNPVSGKPWTRAEATMQVLTSNPRLYEAYLDERPDATANRQTKNAYIGLIAQKIAPMGLGTMLDGVRVVDPSPYNTGA